MSVTITSRAIPSNPRSKNYPSGAIVYNSGDSTTVIQGGGESVDVIAKDDFREMTDKNVLSSLRTLAEIRSRIIKKEDATPASDDNVLSSLRTLEEVNKVIVSLLEALEEKYLSKTRSDRTPYSLEVGEDLTVDGNASVGHDLNVGRNATVGNDLTVMEILRALIKIETAALSVSGNSKTGTLDVAGKATARDVEVANQVTSLNAVIRALATIHNLTVGNTADIMHGIIRQYLSSDKFVSGFLGEGFKVWQDAAGLWHGELDMLTVRKVFTVFELVVQKVVHQGGMVIRSAAGGKITKVTDGGSYWRCEHDSSDDFVKDDQVLCQVFTGTKMKRYWRLVTSAGAGYFNLSKTDCEAGSATPEVDDEVAVLGNRTNAARQSAQVDCAVGANAPYRDDYAGISSYSLVGKLVTRTGNLSGIVDPDFGALSGYGLYSLNAYLKGMLRLTSGKTVETAIGEARSGAISVAASDAQAKADAAKQAAISTAANDATAKANRAENNAKTHAQAILDALQIGGRNLIPGSGQLRINSGKSLGSNYIPGQQYTISIERSVNISPGTQKGALMMLYCSDVSPYPLRVYIPISETRQVATFTYPQAGKGNLALCATEAWTGTTDVTKLKIEKGAKATDWTPAPEDVEAGIDLEIKKVRTDFDVREGQISSKVAEVTAKTQQAVSAAETAASEAGKAKSSADTAAAKLITVTEKESNINQTAGQIATSVAEVTRQAGIASNAANNANTALETVSTKQTQINQVAADIDLKASRAEQAAGRAEEAEARVNIAADGVVINAAKQAAQLAVDGVQIGGRNLLRNTSGVRAYSFTGWQQYFNAIAVGEYGLARLREGGIFTLSALLDSSEGNYPQSITLHIVTSSASLGYRRIQCNRIDPGSKSLTSGALTLPADSNVTAAYIRVAQDTGNAYLATGTFSRVMLIAGNKLSDWTPAPEDTEADATAKADAAKQSAISDAAAKYPTKTEYSAQLAVLNSSISSKVSQTDFNALGTRMSTAEEKITPASIISTVSSTVESAKASAISAAAGDATAKADAAKQAAISTAANDATIKANAAENNAKAHANNTFTPITTYNTKVAQLENLIRLKAESSTVSGLTTRMAAAEAKITPDAINLTVKEQITTAVGNVQVGGRNYVILSKLESWIAATSVPVVTGTDVNMMLTKDNTTSQFLILRIKDYVPETGTYTVSGYMTIGGRPAKNADFLSQSAHTVLENKGFRVDDATGYFEGTHVYNGNNPWLLYMNISANTGTPVKIGKFKFEKGNKASDWTLSPEDADAALQIGGRNLYRKSTVINNLGNNPTIQKEVDADSVHGFKLTGKQSLVCAVRIKNVISENGDYVISFWGKSNGSGTPKFDICNNQCTGDATFTTEWKKFELKAKVNNYTADGYHFIDIENIAFLYYWFKDFKVEKGTKATDWTPAPEDVEADVTNATNKANAAQGAANNAQGTANNALSTANGAQSDINNLKGDLLKTGINITSKQVTVTADIFRVQDRTGKAIAVFKLDDAGNPVLETGRINAREVVTSDLVAERVSTTDIITGRLTVIDGAKVAGFRVSGSSLTNANDTGQYTNDASIIFRNDAKSCFAGIGGNVMPTSSGLRAVARFENEDTSDQWGLSANYAMIVSARGANDNCAISLLGGYVSRFAEKVEVVTSSRTIDISTTCVLCVNTSDITLTLPTMQKYDNGHIIEIKNLGNNSVTINTGYGYHIDGTQRRTYMHVDRGSHVTSLTIGGNGDAMRFVYARDINNGSQYGCWAQFKNPRDW